MPFDEHGLGTRDRAILHVQPFDQLRTLGHRQFLMVEQHAHPLGQPMLANGMEGFRSFMPSLINAVAASLGVEPPLGSGSGNGGLERGGQVHVRLPGANPFMTAVYHYLVAPDQPWLDGFCVQKGLIRQFVAMPLGQGLHGGGADLWRRRTWRHPDHRLPDEARSL